MKAWRELFQLPRSLWLISAAMLINRAGTMALPFLVLYLTRELSFSAGSAGGVLAVYGICSLFAAVLSGRLCDRFGAFRVMSLSLFLSGVLLLCYPFVRSLGGIFVLTCLWAVASEAFRPAALALVTELAPSGLRKQAFALNRLAVNLGMSVGPAAGGFLAQVSFSLLFWVDGMTTLLATLFLWGFLKLEPRPQHLEVPASAGRGFWMKALGGLTDARLRLFLLSVIPVGMVFFQLNATLPLFLTRHLGFSESTYGLIFTLNTVLIILLEIPLNNATAHWSHRRTLTLGTALIAVGFGSLAVAATLSAVLVTIVIWTFGEMILFPGMSAFVAAIAPSHRRGEYMGLYSMAFGVAFILGPLLGTQLLERFGGVTLWGCMLVLGLISTCLVARVRE